MPGFSLEKMYALLGTHEVPGTDQQLQKLCIRLSELARINGEKWIIQHRKKLLKEWESAIQRKLIK